MTESPEIHPVAAAAIEAAKAKVTTDEMHEFAQREASRIECVQRGLIAVGIRKAPDMAQVRRMVVADALAQWIDRERRGGYA